MTLPPTSPRDRDTYALWKTLAAERALRVGFEAGQRADLEALYESAFCVVTTSVKEGFGFAYLDPLARGIPVVGREIPWVVADFRAEGLSLPGLYREIRVPRAALPAAELRAAVENRLETFRRSYAQAFAAATKGQDDLEKLLAALAGRFETEYLDFGALDESLQAALIREAESGSDLDRELRRRNPFLAGLFDGAPSVEEAERARQTLETRYSAERHALRLRSAYADAVSGRIGGAIDRRRLLSDYLVPESFFLAAS